ncbi:hypothetical protein AYO44_05270 [Planctomycetaceae bacterium SCGC AG-212-F19]|nr:hypothetical protein AYO44_05270 [Planctomycetaceae bacterium SCGC AG-212-F19]
MIIRFLFDVIGIEKPRYLDIGAYHPTQLSNTAHFYHMGSRGINVEPNPLLFPAFTAQRKQDLNLNVGVLDRSGACDFFLMAPDTLSTFSKTDAERHVAEGVGGIANVLPVPVCTIHEILAKLSTDAKPDFLCIDVEGCEEGIFQSMDFTAWSPLVICCETISFSTTGTGRKSQLLIDLIQSRGYLAYADTYINTIFVLERAWNKRSASI